MIPFLDLSRNKELNRELSEASSRIIEKGWFVLGPELESFEEEFSKFCGKDYGIGVNSGTDALELALHSLNIEKGDEVIIPANTAIPTAMAIVNVGARPSLIDVGGDYLIDVEKIEERINSKTKIIMPVHLYGNVCNMNVIEKIAREHNLEVIEDCCQAHGAEFDGKRVPIGDIGCFSFYPSKNLGALGDGGMIVTNRQDLEKKLKLLRNYGQMDKYHAEIQGRNTRLDEIQAAFLRIKLRYLEKGNESRGEHAKLYNSLLEDVVKTPIKTTSKHVYHLYVARTKRRDELMSFLTERGIGTLIHYPIPIHLQEAFSELGYGEGNFPNTEKYSKEIISLPMFPELREEEIVKVCSEIKEFHQR